MKFSRRFTTGECIAFAALIIALLLCFLLTYCSKHGPGPDVDAILAADSAYQAKADSLELVMKQLGDSATADSIRNKRRHKRQPSDSTRSTRRKSAKRKANPYVPKERSYLDETLSPTEAR